MPESEVQFFVRQAQPVESVDAKYPRIDQLENIHLGSVHENEKTGDRLARLELKLFGSVSKSADLAQRTDNIEAYTKQRLNMPILNDVLAQQNLDFDVNVRDNAYGIVEEQSDGHVNIGGKKISKRTVAMVAVGAILLAVSGAGAGGGAGAGAMGGMAGMGAAGMGMPSMGGASMMPAIISGINSGIKNIMFGRVAMKMVNAFSSAEKSNVKEKKKEREAANKRDKDQSDAAEEVHGRIAMEEVPSKDEALVVKVCWCEKQIFGRTFPEKPMLERLKELNQQLIPRSEKEEKFKTNINFLLAKIDEVQSVTSASK
ncbi:MAG: hypothetical protein K2X93_09570 [Candidatus Obscuribacterales bacterium]|nr:hypothetical protein [Candidatus Obscuribacterales bacterium]